MSDSSDSPVYSYVYWNLTPVEVLLGTSIVGIAVFGILDGMIVSRPGVSILFALIVVFYMATLYSIQINRGEPT